MKKPILILMILGLFISSTMNLMAQQSEAETAENASQRMLANTQKLTFGGYGQIDYNQPFGGDKYHNGTLDIHRLVLLFGYKFTNKLSFVTEVEIEHVEEVYVEQAFLNYAINTYFNVRGGLMLIPMGIINEHHEPTTFNGVERPFIDKYISPTTWRELGLGLTGTVPEISMKYQAYLVNGFSSYDKGGTLSGKNGLRSGRQKGIESFISSPNVAARIEYYGLLGLNIGLSAYVGNTQSRLYDGLDKNMENEIASADSSVVGVSMVGFDARYQRKGFQFRGQFYYSALSNTDQYNHFTGGNGTPNDVGSAQMGYYAEVSYNVFHSFGKINSSLIPFFRYSNYNTQQNMASGFTQNDAYQVEVMTAGLGWKIVPGVAIKADVQFLKTKADSSAKKVFNAGIGVWF